MVTSGSFPGTSNAKRENVIADSYLEKSRATQRKGIFELLHRLIAAGRVEVELERKAQYMYGYRILRSQVDVDDRTRLVSPGLDPFDCDLVRDKVNVIVFGLADHCVAKVFIRGGLSGSYTESKL